MISPADKRRYRSSLAAFLILGAGCALSSIAAVWLHAAERARAELHFQREAEKYIVALEHGLHDAQAALTTLCRLVGSMDQLSAAQFTSISSTLKSHTPGIQAIAYLPSSVATVPAAEEASQDIVATGELDKASMQELRQTAQRAISLDLPVASHAFSSASGKPGGAALAIAVPVQGKKTPDAAVAMVLQVDELARQAWKRAGIAAGDNMISFVYELEAGRRTQLVFSNGIGNAVFTVENGQDEQRGAAYAMSRRIDVVNGQWQMDVIMERGLPGTQYVSALLVLFSGWLLTGLAAWYVFRLGYRTRSLASANRVLVSNVLERERSERELRQSQRELRDLASYQERVKEDERKRIAREIHDDLGQSMLVLRIDISILMQEYKGKDARLYGRLQAIMKQTDATIRSVRAIINNLRPGVLDLGLLAALEWQVKQMNGLHGVQFELLASDDGFSECLNDELATSVFRVVQEAMSNVVRHANARHAWISLGFDGDMMKVTIKDDGASPYPGDQRKPRSFGLVGIKERISAMGGEFSIQGTPGDGTTLTLLLPRTIKTEDQAAVEMA